DRAWLERGRSAPVHPAATWGRLLAPAVTLAFSALTFRALHADITIGDEGLPLDPYGVPGDILHTPGHTAGSVSVVLRDGSAIVGDLAMSGFPALRRHAGLPIVADDLDAVAASWRRLLAQGVVTAYPGHGRPFPAEGMRPIVAARAASVPPQEGSHAR
ncbi:MAG: hypothetical protein QME94_05075, partial [Anaerolineae bacterium]|nr:hypothetical protein [Anaerolineae bacterium]